MFSPSPGDSSTHEHRSDVSSRSISLSPAPSNSALTKKPRKRKGKVVSVLRERYAFDADSDEHNEKQLVAYTSKISFSPTSALSVIQREEMMAGLNHHLVSLGFSVVGQMGFPLWADLQAALERLKASLGAQRTSPTTNIQLKALAALGARRSSHSAIFASDLERELGRTGTGDVVQLALGRRREAVCAQLVEDAIEASREAGHFDHYSQDSVDTLALLRMLLNASSPRHPALLPLVHATGRNYRAGVSTVAEASSLIASDAGCALFFGTDLSVTDDELVSFGWPAPRIEEMKRRLNALPHGTRLDENTMFQLREFVISSMRRLAQYRSRGWKGSHPLPVPARALFDDVFEISEAMEKAVLSLQLWPLSCGPPAVRSLRSSYHLYKLPVFFLSAAIRLARDLIRTGVDADAEEYHTEAKTRYCAWFKVFATSIDWIKDDSIEVFSSAVLVEGLEFLDDWMDIVLEAARQSAAQSGPLARAGLTWDHLRHFQRLLKISSTVFASSDMHEQELSQQLAMLDLAGGAGARKADENELADKMLKNALLEMLME